MKKCPRCAEQIQDDAKACPHCGYGLTIGTSVGCVGTVGIVLIALILLVAFSA